MKAQIRKTIAVFTILLLLFTLLYGMWFREQLSSASITGNDIVAIHEAGEIIRETYGENPAQQQFDQIQKQLRQKEQSVSTSRNLFLLLPFLLILLIYIILLLLYIYTKILRPFHKLEHYAEELAKGNMEVSLPYERTNFFGAFTWAFDHMRKELLHARQREETAIQDNKTIIATLTHDIKTPIASIRAYAEGLEANLASTYEQRQRYASIIMKKCDEVTSLSDDLLLHSLSELERLEIQCQRVEIGSLLSQILHNLEHPFVQVQESLPSAEVSVDPQRMEQVMENILNNASKYASGKVVEVWAVRCSDSYKIHIRDHGEGIPPEDIPFIFQKFYRGHNVNDQKGSGLGLFIVKYIMEQMNGAIHLVHEDGLEVVLTLPLDEEPEPEINSMIYHS